MPTIEKTSVENARLNFRLPSEIKERIENAASVSGVTVTDFAISALVDSADEVLENYRKRKLNDRDRDIFLEMIENPPAPNKALREAVKEHRRRVKKNEI
ncbi:MAG: DUF1778 domain-containing protein [Acidobacteriota bacterium]|nr:DUF1778 domain-containing protein [Acidobacteriota bacterium]